MTKIEDSLQCQPSVADLWKLETIGINPIEEQKDEKEEAMEHFKDTVKMKDNRYHISWPWRKDNFTQTLRRFIARRGTPKEIISDNASQFKLAISSIEIAWNKVIQDIDVQSHVAEQGIKWNFIVELSPWMGGFYERLVGSSKMALRKSIGRNCLTMLQLQTFFNRD